jgi:hypothetical protein
VKDIPANLLSEPNNSKRRLDVRKIGLVVLVAGIALGYGNTVLARGGGDGHDGMGGRGEGGRGGAALDRRSQEGSENSNAQWSTNATKGQDRSDMRNQDGQGRGHGKDHGGKAHGHGKGQGGQGNQGSQNRDSN